MIYNTYDPQGQRIRKTSGTAVTYFVYDEQGQLLGEYDQNRSMIREYLWMGDRLVGMMSAQIPNVVLRVHTDHLGTPRAVSQGATVLWRWEGDQFGDVLPNEDVDGNGIPFTMPIRHAGQYFDSEVGVFYNYFRDYDPATGRYLQSDPIGLQGGLNTYGYVGGNVTGAVDPTGEVAFLAIPFLAGGATTGTAATGAVVTGTAASGGFWATGALIGGALLMSGDTPASQDNNTASESRSIPMPNRPNCGCTCICRADANLNDSKNTAGFAFGTATEHNCSTASKIAKRNATRALGQQPKHVGCRCAGG